jgi:hypothetical protein
MSERPFAVLSIDEQIAAFERATPRRPISQAMRDRLRRSIERGWTIFDPASNRFQLTDLGRKVIDRPASREP